MYFPLVVTPEKLGRLINALPWDNPAKLTVHCVDGLTLYPHDLEQLSELPNAAPYAIESLAIQSSFNDGSHWQITFSNTSTGPASYSVSGTDDFVTVNSDIIAKHISGMAGERPHLATLPLFVEVSGPLITGLGISGCLLSLLFGFAAKTLPIPAALSLFFTSLLVAILGTVLERSVKTYFPKVSFCVGNGADRYDRILHLRRQLGVGAVLAFVISVLANLLTFRMTSK